MQNRYILAVSPSEIKDVIATNFCETEVYKEFLSWITKLNVYVSLTLAERCL